MQIILAIDTSCDETSVAVTKNLTILSNVVSSQIEQHKLYGGVLPSLARLAHQDKINTVIDTAMKRAHVGFNDIDVIAVTQGPGLAIALEVGINKAIELASMYNKPLICVNHMEGHLLSGFAQKNSFYNIKFNLKSIKFPVLGFLISGGHTEMILVREFGKYEKIGETLDDSCGEAYDKCGRMLGLGYPAGPIISKFAKMHRNNTILTTIRHNQSTNIKLINKVSKKEYQLPVSMAHSANLNFSYSGLKTAFKLLINKLTNNNARNLDKDEIFDLSTIFEAAAISQLTIKLTKAIEYFHPEELWLGGGVIASTRLKFLFRKICKKNTVTIRLPYSNKLTGDNAAMIGMASYFKTYNTKNFINNPSSGIYVKDFSRIERLPSLSL